MEQEKEKSKAGEAAKEVAKQTGKKIGKNILKKMAPFLIKIVVMLLLIMAAAALLFGIFEAIGSAVQNAIAAIVDFFTIDTDGSIAIDDTQTDTIINSITSLGVDMEGLKLMGDKADYSDPDVQEKNQEALRKYIEKFLEAQVITQTINRNQIESTNKTYGRVYINKATGDTTENNINLTYIPYEQMTQKQVEQTSQGTSNVSSLDNFLFIGDSRTAGMKSQLESLGNNVTVLGVVSSGPSHWENATRNGQGTVLSESVTLPSSENVKGISVALGVNGISYQAENMKTILNNLLQRYPNTPIFVNSVFYVGSGYTTVTASTYNSYIDTYNTKIKDFCNANANLIYIDISEGLHESGYLKSTYTGDSLHLNGSGNTKLLENIKNNIINSGTVDVDTDTADQPQTQPQNQAPVRVDAGDITGNFSISPEGKLVISGKVNTVVKKNGTIVTDETVIDIKEVDYRNIISQYTTSANFLIFLTMISQNPEFAAAVTELIKDSDIQITIMENKDITIMKEEYSYTVNKKTSSTDETTNDISEPVYANPQTVTETTETIITSTMPKIGITYAKTWFSEQNIQYTKNTTSKNINSIEIPGEPVNETEPTTNGQGEQTWRTNIKTVVTTSGSTEKYEESYRGDVKDRTGEIGDGEDSFIGLMDVKFRIPNQTGKYAAGDNIVSGAEWLFSLLQKDPSSQNLEQIMRYILYKYTGKDYGVTDFDFSIFDAKEFTNISGRIYGNTVEEKVWFTLRSLGYSEYATAGAMGNIYRESGFNPAIIEYGNGIGFGLCQWSFGRRTQLEAYAASKGVDPSDVDTQIEFLIGELTPGGGADGYASYQLMTTTYAGRHTPEEWLNATSVEDATVAFCYTFERPAENSSGLQIRIQAALSYYQQFQGREAISGGAFNGNNSSDSRIVGTFTSDITGKTFTIFNQCAISGWGSCCNRAAQISVCSGYLSMSADQLINTANSSCPRQTSLYNSAGLTFSNQGYGLGAPYTFDSNKIKEQLQNRGYVLLYTRGSNKGYSGYSKTSPGVKWASSMHWVAILGYGIIDGEEKIFVSDSGHGNTGWWPLNEFDGIVDTVVFVNEK